MADLIDAAGVPLADHALWLPPRVSDWPRPRKIADKKAARWWKVDLIDRHCEERCWWCAALKSWDVVTEVHHMARHDAPWAFALLCSECHRTGGDAVKASSLHRMIRLKHQYDQRNTLWVQLALGLGRFLPVEPGCNICGDELVGDEVEICSACGGGDG